MIRFARDGEWGGLVQVTHLSPPDDGGYDISVGEDYGTEKEISAEDGDDGSPLQIEIEDGPLVGGDVAPVVAPASTPDLNPLLQEVVKQNQALQEGLLKSQTNISQIGEGLSGLSSALHNQNQMATQRMTGETEEEERERLNKEFYTDPYGNLRQVMGQRDQTLVNSFGKALAQQGKQLLLSNPDKANRYQKYKSEMDDAFNRIPPNAYVQDPTILDRIYEAVLGKHAGEIEAETIDQLVNQKLEARLAELGITGNNVAGGGNNNQPSQPTPSRMVLSNQQSIPNTAVSRSNVVKLTTKRAAEIKRLADDSGLEYEDLVRTLRDSGQL